MKISGYYIYNNVAITAFAIMSMLSVSPRIPLSKVALLMPILLDDNITLLPLHLETSLNELVNGC